MFAVAGRSERTLPALCPATSSSPLRRSIQTLVERIWGKIFHPFLRVLGLFFISSCSDEDEYETTSELPSLCNKALHTEESNCETERRFQDDDTPPSEELKLSNSANIQQNKLRYISKLENKWNKM